MPGSFFPSSWPREDLPDFSTLLVKGLYHASAPIHLCLTHVAQYSTAKAILIAPSREAFVRDLQDLDDEWLSSFAGHGRIAGLSSRIEVHYPPSAAHLALFLSTLRILSAYVEGSPKSCKNAYSNPPSLIVLQGLSSYFSNSEATHTVSSYLTLVIRAISAIGVLQSGQIGARTALAVFDSVLDDLKLPVTSILPLSFDAPQASDSAERSRGLQPVAPLAERYFEWVGTVRTQKVSSQDDGSETFSVRLECQVQGGGKKLKEFEWSLHRGRGPSRHSTERRGTVFS